MVSANIIWFIWSSLNIILILGIRPDIMNHPNWRLLPTEDNCGHSVPLDRIIGGKQAALGQYPWIARLGYTATCTLKPVFQCGGALINERYVVTASHCVNHLPKIKCGDITAPFELSVIRLGENYVNSAIDCDGEICAEPVQDLHPEVIISHKNYGTPPYHNDIGLVRLREKPILNGWVYPICMPSFDQLSKSYEGVSAEVAGFGIFDMKKKKPSDALLTLTIPITNTAQCAQLYEGVAQIGSSQICAGGSIGKDSCGGDSGGPLMTIEARNGQPPAYYLLGVVSFGSTICASTTQPGVYTRISSFIDWILNNMEP